MDDELIWRGVREANPWWAGRAGQTVPPERTRTFHRDAFEEVRDALLAVDRGRGIVLLGPRRVGKSVLLHQLVDALLAQGVAPLRIVLLSLDDVTLRGVDLGRLLDLVTVRAPVADGVERWLLLDEVQHAPEWAAWLKRIADRRDPWRFLATGSSATALRHGGQDAGLGRWREMTLFPWSFREHVRFRGDTRGGSRLLESLATRSTDDDSRPGSFAHVPITWPPESASALDEILIDYLVLGGFPEVLERADVREAQRHLRQDILDRALGRDVVDIESVDTRALERLFLRVCHHPGGLWNATEVANDLQISRPTVARYLDILVRAFLAFEFRNLASPIKGQPKVYLVAPSLRSALLHVDHESMRDPTTWGPAVENLVASTLMSARDLTMDVGFWRQGTLEVDGVVRTGRDALVLEVKTGRKRGAERSLERAASGLGLDPAHARATILVRDASLCGDRPIPGFASASTVHVAQWLWCWQPAFGGAVRT
jgi:predicted AAA+ superfamily ATPase